MDSAFKKFAKETSTAFNRAKQFTEERLGGAERTELDAHFENMLQRAEVTRIWTDKMARQTEAVVQPDLGMRLEDMMNEKLGTRRDRMTNTEWLGEYFMQAGDAIGSASPYGGTLVQVGQTEQELGMCEKEFGSSASSHFIRPLRNFLEGDMKMLQKEKKTLEVRRLDLDACKSKLKRAKSQQSENTAENELRVAQSEFDKQCEMTKLVLESINSTHAYHLRCLQEFVQAQTEYHAKCHHILQQLQGQIATATSSGASSATRGVHFGETGVNAEGFVTLSAGGGGAGGGVSPTAATGTHMNHVSSTAATEVEPSAPPPQLADSIDAHGI